MVLACFQAKQPRGRLKLSSSRVPKVMVGRSGKKASHVCMETKIPGKIHTG